MDAVSILEGLRFEEGAEGFELQRQCLEILCSEIIMSENIDSIVARFPPEATLALLVDLFHSELLPVDVRELTARALTYFLDVDPSIVARFAGFEWGISSLCDVLISAVVSIPESRAVAEQVLKALEIVSRRAPILVLDSGGLQGVFNFLREIELEEIPEDIIASAVACIRSVFSELLPSHIYGMASYALVIPFLRSRRTALAKEALSCTVLFVERALKERSVPPIDLARSELLEYLIVSLAGDGGSLDENVAERERMRSDESDEHLRRDGGLHSPAVSLPRTLARTGNASTGTQLEAERTMERMIRLLVHLCLSSVEVTKKCIAMGVLRALEKACDLCSKSLQRRALFSEILDLLDMVNAVAFGKDTAPLLFRGKVLTDAQEKETELLYEHLYSLLGQNMTKDTEITAVEVDEAGPILGNDLATAEKKATESDASCRVERSVKRGSGEKGWPLSESEKYKESEKHLKEIVQCIKDIRRLPPAALLKFGEEGENSLLLPAVESRSAFVIVLLLDEAGVYPDLVAFERSIELRRWNVVEIFLRRGASGGKRLLEEFLERAVKIRAQQRPKGKRNRRSSMSTRAQTLEDSAELEAKTEPSARGHNQSQLQVITSKESSLYKSGSFDAADDKGKPDIVRTLTDRDGNDSITAAKTHKGAVTAKTRAESNVEDNDSVGDTISRVEDESAQDRVTGADIELCRILLQKLQKGEFKITRHPCLVGWGGNDFHMLVEKKEWAIPPEVLEHFDGVKLAQVCGGSEHLYALTANGFLYAWGNGVRGRLGLGLPNKSHSTPQLVLFDRFPSVKVEWVSSGSWHGAFTTSDGSLYTFGNGDHRRLGHGSDADEPTPKRVAALVEAGYKAERVACGDSHTLAIAMSPQGRRVVLTWGRGTKGKLGFNSEESIAKPTVLPFFLSQSAASTLLSAHEKQKPLLLPSTPSVEFAPSLPEGVYATSVYAGLHFSVVQTSDGALYSFGEGERGQLGSGRRENRRVPCKVWPPLDNEGDVTVQAFSAGAYHCLVATKRGAVYGWGSNEGNRLGFKEGRDIVLPQRLSILEGKEIVQVSAGHFASLVLTKERELLTLGRPTAFSPVGRQGDGLRWGEASRYLSVVEVPTNFRPNRIVCGLHYAFALGQLRSEQTRETQTALHQASEQTEGRGMPEGQEGPGARLSFQEDIVGFSPALLPSLYESHFSPLVQNRILQSLVRFVSFVPSEVIDVLFHGKPMSRKDATVGDVSSSELEKREEKGKNITMSELGLHLLEFCAGLFQNNSKETNLVEACRLLLVLSRRGGKEIMEFFAKIGVFELLSTEMHKQNVLTQSAVSVRRDLFGESGPESDKALPSLNEELNGEATTLMRLARRILKLGGNLDETTEPRTSSAAMVLSEKVKVLSERLDMMSSSNVDSLSHALFEVIEVFDSDRMTMLDLKKSDIIGALSAFLSCCLSNDNKTVPSAIRETTDIVRSASLCCSVLEACYQLASKSSAGICSFLAAMEKLILLLTQSIGFEESSPVRLLADSSKSVSDVLQDLLSLKSRMVLSYADVGVKPGVDCRDLSGQRVSAGVLSLGSAILDTVASRSRKRWFERDREIWSMVQDLGTVRAVVSTPSSPSPPPPPPSMPSSVLPLHLTFSKIGDKKGIVYYLGTDGYREDWTNPVRAGIAEVWTSAGRAFEDGDGAMVLSRGPSARNCHTFEREEAFVAIDFGCWISPSSYSLRQAIGREGRMVAWALEGSTDGRHWWPLRKHEQEVSFFPGAVGHWQIDTPMESSSSTMERTSAREASEESREKDEEVSDNGVILPIKDREGRFYFRAFRVRLLSPAEPSNEWRVSLSGFEIYGWLKGFCEELPEAIATRAVEVLGRRWDDVVVGGRIEVGARVRRGPDWDWDDQDLDEETGEPGEGTVKAVTKSGWAQVVWDNGFSETYRVGADSAIDLVRVQSASNDRMRQSSELEGQAAFGGSHELDLGRVLPDSLRLANQLTAIDIRNYLRWPACSSCKKALGAGRRIVCLECRGLQLCSSCTEKGFHAESGHWLGEVDPSSAAAHSPIKVFRAGTQLCRSAQSGSSLDLEGGTLPEDEELVVPLDVDAMTSAFDPRRAREISQQTTAPLRFPTKVLIGATASEALDRVRVRSFILEALRERAGHVRLQRDAIECYLSCPSFNADISAVSAAQTTDDETDIATVRLDRERTLLSHIIQMTELVGDLREEQQQRRRLHHLVKLPLLLHYCTAESKKKTNSDKDEAAKASAERAICEEGVSAGNLEWSIVSVLWQKVVDSASRSSAIKVEGSDFSVQVQLLFRLHTLLSAFEERSAVDGYDGLRGIMDKEHSRSDETIANRVRTLPSDRQPKNSVSSSSFLSMRVTNKLRYILQDIVVRASGAVPTWALLLSSWTPAMLSFETRYNLFLSLAPPLARRIERTLSDIKRAEGNEPSRRPSRHLSILQSLLSQASIMSSRSPAEIGRLKHVCASLRREPFFLLDLAAALEAASTREEALDFTFEGEEGTGTGVTKEAYTLACTELSRSCLGLWLDESLRAAPESGEGWVTEQHSVEAATKGGLLGREEEAEKEDKEGHVLGPIVTSPVGLFPRPYDQDRVPDDVLANFDTFGALVGRALIDEQLLSLKLSPALLRLLRGEKLGLVDLKDVDPERYRALKALAAFALKATSSKRTAVEKSSDSVEYKKELHDEETVKEALVDWEIGNGEVTQLSLDDLCLDFTITLSVPSGGLTKRVEIIDLVANGSATAVTAENVDRYLEAVVDFFLCKGIQKQLQCLFRGISSVFSPKFLAFFYPSELASLLTGDEEALNWTEQELASQLEPAHGYRADSPQFLLLCKYLANARREEKQLFLRFVTGSSSLPPGGLSTLEPPIKVVRKDVDGDPDKALVSANTCFHFLKLPPFTSLFSLSERIAESMANLHFGLN